MSRIKIDNKEFALSPLSLDDAGTIEHEAASDEMVRSEMRIMRMDRLKIGTEADRMAILDRAQADIDSGDAEARFIRSFAGQSMILWLSAKKLVGEMSLEEFRRKVALAECKKAAALIYPPEPTEESVKPEEKYKAAEAQEDLRTRIFNAICEAEKLAPMDLKTMVENDIGRAVELFCKYSNTNKCNPDLLKQRVEEYVAKAR